MIDLSNQIPFASGSNRHCYRHPSYPDRCLKVIRPENIEARYQLQPALKKLLGKKRLNDNLQEIEAHEQTVIQHLLKQGQEDLVWAHLPRFYGQTATAQGPANESEFLTNPEGGAGETFEHYLARAGFDETAEALAREFTDWLQRTEILTRNLLPHNLVLGVRNEKLRLFLVDGLGAPPIPSLLSTSQHWRLHYIDRRIRRFYKRIEWETKGRKDPWELSQKL